MIRLPFATTKFRNAQARQKFYIEDEMEGKKCCVHFLCY